MKSVVVNPHGRRLSSSTITSSIIIIVQPFQQEKTTPLGFLRPLRIIVLFLGFLRPLRFIECSSGSWVVPFPPTPTTIYNYTNLQLPTSETNEVK